MKFKLDIENKDQVIKWLNRIKKGTDDARPLWKAMTPKINLFVNNQFRNDNDKGKRWKSLEPSYKAWKIKKGFSSGIGVKDGDLKVAAGKFAIKKYKKKSLTWMVDQGEIAYAKHFDKTRPVYKNIALRVNDFLSFDIKQFEKGSYNSFTYIWLRDALRVK